MIHRSFIRNFKPFTLLVVLLAATNTVSADDWPAWRGLRGDGVSLEVDVPLSWSTDSNIAWRTELPGVGLFRGILCF
jgi:hypothetical protein